MIYNEKFTNEIFEQLEKKSFLKKNKLRKPDYKLKFYEFLIYNNFYINLKFSYYREGSGLALHRDQGFKELALLIYMGFSDNIKRDNGGTQLYNVTDKKICSHMVPIDKVNNFKLLHNHKPYENSILGFKRTSNSWHAVSPLKLPNNVYRLNIQINFMRLNTLEFENSIIDKIKYRIINFKLILYRILNKEM